MNFLKLHRGSAPLILSIPHAGTHIPEEFQHALRSLWLARKDADWWLPELYQFAEAYDATILCTEISRTVIDLNRDPSGVSLYPGQATTGLCPTTTFDDEPLYLAGHEPDDTEILLRRAKYFDPYHETLRAEISRLRGRHHAITIYDCHSIRSEIPHLFEGLLPNFNIGSNDDRSCDPVITEKIAAICETEKNFSYVANGRFKGGYITRHYGNPANGVNAIQMELACRGYMAEPSTPSPANWPTPLDTSPAILPTLRSILESLLP
ncbi:MAG: N-formylglutamate deformylase [Acidocella sp. 20-61-6]|nr:MAG: N-formylglutamate deformylase [Acidocella sp. 20-61-6]